MPRAPTNSCPAQTKEKQGNMGKVRGNSLLLGASESSVGLGPRVVAVAENGVISMKCYDRSSCRDRQIGRSAGKLKKQACNFGRGPDTKWETLRAWLDGRGRQER